MVSHPDISWRNDRTPVSEQFDDPYFSVDNGLEESRYVFLHRNGLPDRWQHHSGAFSIVETGFGTGLNFLATCQAFTEFRRKNPTSQVQLHFTSIEKYPLSPEQLSKALQAWPMLAEFSVLLKQDYQPGGAGIQNFRWPLHDIQLTLYFSDVAQALPAMQGPVHAWYLDGFAPAKNPSMWSAELFSEMRRLSHLTHLTCSVHPTHPAHLSHGPADPQPVTTVATFTAAGIVKRGLKGAGFAVKKVDGFGTKRDMLIGQYLATQGPERVQPRYWTEYYRQLSHKQRRVLNTAPRPVHQPTEPPRIAVIGAGLAGCHSARALADSGHRVTLIDPLGIAGGASGNPQGGLYVKLAANQQSAHSDFYLQAFQYAIQQIQYQLGKGNSNNPHWQQCGVFQLAYDEKEQRRQQQYLSLKQPSEDLVSTLTAEAAEHSFNSRHLPDGLYFPTAGWVDPRAWCHALVSPTDKPSKPADGIEGGINDSGIELIKAKVLQVEPLPNEPSGSTRWQLTLDNGQPLEFDQLVFTTAWQTGELLPDAYLPTKKIRGQLTYCRTDLTDDLDTVLCGKHYAAPANDGIFCIGASYDQRSDDHQPRHQDDLNNIEHWRDFGDSWLALTDPKSVVGQRVGFRCTTPDYLPMVGPVIDNGRFFEQFGALARNAKYRPNVPVPTIPGVWLNIGHGSRGLASTALSASLLASQINQSPAPVSLELQDALMPGRFLIRDTIRNRLPSELAAQLSAFQSHK